MRRVRVFNHIAAAAHLGGGLGARGGGEAAGRREHESSHVGGSKRLAGGAGFCTALAIYEDGGERTKKLHKKKNQIRATGQKPKNLRSERRERGLRD